jgi:hypothetical protein
MIGSPEELIPANLNKPSSLLRKKIEDRSEFYTGWIEELIRDRFCSIM